jgi:hypothetical protein
MAQLKDHNEYESIMYWKFAKKADLHTLTTYEKYQLGEVMDMLIILIMEIIFQCIYVSKHHIALHKFIQFLLVN